MDDCRIGYKFGRKSFMEVLYKLEKWAFIWNEDLNELSSCINHTNAITLQKYAQNYEKLLYTNGLNNTLISKLEVKNKSIVWDH